MNTGKYTCIEVFAKSKTGKSESVKVISGNGKCQEQEVGTFYYEWIKFKVSKNEDYVIDTHNCAVSLCYLSGSDDLLDSGVCYLEPDSAGEMCIRESKKQYNSPIREQYHFVPWKNWMNDPNGLCWYQGRYHMFYQFNPHSQEWSNMYWGHAVSKDLIHWVHLPVVLEPQEEILKNPQNIKGGAFSGSAVVLDNEVVFYLTRHIGPLKDCEETVQKQWMMKSQDMIHFTPEQLMIEKRPENASFHFRDPKVLKVKDTWYMVLASAMNDKAAILLYSSKDMENWKYLHPLLIEETEGIECFECPDFMELDGKYLALGAWMCHYDEQNRYQMSRYYIGEFENEQFRKESEGWFDFGSNCYAMQSFCHEGRRINIGWISDFYKEHLEWNGGAYGSMTIPREMHVRDGRLFLTPVEEIDLLEGEILYSGEKENINLNQIPGNTYRARITFNEETEFSILLGKDNEKEILLLNDKKGVRIQTRGVRSENILFKADVEKVEFLDIFVDHRVIEVYINEGEAVGTKLFYNTSESGCFMLNAEKQEAVKKAEISLMKSIW